jgi:tRNA dimethylallyltransferase
MSKVIVIGGQTASGKSDLAVCVALLLKKHGINSEIISADSRQVYIGGDKISAKISTKDMNGIPHHMLNISSMKKDYNVADYKKVATKIIKDLHKKNIVPIICGGTGLYIDNLIYKKTIPEVLPNPTLRAKLEKLTAEDLFSMLEKKDPIRAKNIDAKNKRRLIRALEIIAELGYVPEEEKPELLYKTLFIGLTLPKEILELKIVKRTNTRMKLGMLKEIQTLHESGLSYDRLQSFGMEYKWLSLYAQKLITKEECISGINKDTMAYAKRQMTWFKKNKDIVWLNMSNPKESGNTTKKMVLDFLK